MFNFLKPKPEYREGEWYKIKAEKFILTTSSSSGYFPYVRIEKDCRNSEGSIPCTITKQTHDNSLFMYISKYTYSIERYKLESSYEKVIDLRSLEKLECLYKKALEKYHQEEVKKKRLGEESLSALINNIECCK